MGHKLSIDLIPIKLGEFDLILGIDWLYNHGAMIDCQKKSVNIRILNQLKVIFYGSKLPKRSCFLTMTQVQKLLRKRCVGYLCHVVDTQQVEADMGQIHVVNEFADVFPDEFPGLLSNREVKFVIDIVPGTTPVSKAPYCMAPVKMKELMI